MVQKTDTLGGLTDSQDSIGANKGLGWEGPYQNCDNPGGDCNWIGGLIQLIL